MTEIVSFVMVALKYDCWCHVVANAHIMYIAYAYTSAYAYTVCAHGFPERGCILEHQIFSLGKVILRDRCSTSYDLASLFRGRRSTLDRWSGKVAKRIGKRPSALHSAFHN